MDVSDQSFETMRQAMVASQLRTNSVSDPRVVAAMARVPRERFVPDSRRQLAYVDIAVPVAEGRALCPPMVLGRLLTEARPRPSDHALIVGAATGYSAAVLASLVASVVALEEAPAMIAQARALLAGEGAVEIVEGPLTDGWAAAAPYDLILVDGAIETLPPALIEQLAPTGRLAAAVVENGVCRLAVGRRAGKDVTLVGFADAAAPALPGFEPIAGFRF
jgi:protein-L-isoaspartate(D-aspartate) O-methyltransferase